jgi:carbamoyl-phosphate synthase small subunit
MREKSAKLLQMEKQLFLTLADKTVITGKSFGADAVAEGEVVFVTGMVGYPESFTDPSFAGQILVLTYPLVGNYGIPEKICGSDGISQNFESNKIHIAGLVVSEYSEKYSHHAAKQSLSAWLKSEGIPAITGVDTRALTQKLREFGTILGSLDSRKRLDGKFYDPSAENIVAKVDCEKPTFHKRGKKTVAILDCGMKLNIIRNFLDRGVSVWHLPHDYDLSEIEYDGLFISNGPGDPMQAKAAIASTREALNQDKPIFGICLGHQILAIAAGIKTYKLPYGHRSQNQPVREVSTGKCFVTSQNHGYAVDKKMKNGFEVSYENINDKSVEGLKHKTKPFFSVQFHPEACPGPTDTEFLFDEFVKKL